MAEKHILVKFQEQNPDFPHISSVSEHLNVDSKQGSVIWGHFTKRDNVNDMSKGEKEIIEEQLKQGIPTYVFFYNRPQRLLYVGRLVQIFNRNEYESVKKALVPEYYVHRVGKLPEKGQQENLIYLYLQVKDLRHLPFEDTEFILQAKNNIPIQDVRGMSSIFYVNLSPILNQRIVNMYEYLNPIIVDEPQADAEMKLGEITNVDKIENTPKSVMESSITSEKTRGPIKINHLVKQLNNDRLGKVGELLVVEYEKQRLINAGRNDLADRVKHIAADNDEAGYDVLSFEEVNETEMYIEAKTTTKGEETPFFISAPEADFSEAHADNYYLYRLYDYDKKTGNCKMFIQQGNVKEKFNLKPQTYLVSK